MKPDVTVNSTPFPPYEFRYLNGQDADYEPGGIINGKTSYDSIEGNEFQSSKPMTINHFSYKNLELSGDHGPLEAVLDAVFNVVIVALMESGLRQEIKVEKDRLTHTLTLRVKPQNVFDALDSETQNTQISRKCDLYKNDKPLGDVEDNESINSEDGHIDQSVSAIIKKEPEMCGEKKLQKQISATSITVACSVSLVKLEDTKAYKQSIESRKRLQPIRTTVTKEKDPTCMAFFNGRHL